MECELIYDVLSNEKLNDLGVKTETYIEPMTVEEKVIYFKVFSILTELTEDNIDELPERVSNCLDWFKKNYHHENIVYFIVKSPEFSDPLLIAKYNSYNWYTHLLSDKIYLIARWGNALMPFSKLKEKVTALFRNRLVLHASKQEAYWKMLKESPDLIVDEFIAFGSVKSAEIINNIFE